MNIISRIPQMLCDRKRFYREKHTCSIKFYMHHNTNFFRKRYAYTNVNETVKLKKRERKTRKDKTAS